MNVQLTRPDLEQFVAQKVESGEFPSPQAVVENALARAMEEEVTLDDQDIQSIDEAAAQIARGEGIDFQSFADEMKKKYGIS